MSNAPVDATALAAIKAAIQLGQDLAIVSSHTNLWLRRLDDGRFAVSRGDELATTEVIFDTIDDAARCFLRTRRVLDQRAKP